MTLLPQFNNPGVKKILFVKRKIKQFYKCGVAFPKCVCLFSDFQLLEKEDNIFFFYLITCWNFSFKNEIEDWLTTVWYTAQAIKFFSEQKVLCILKREMFHVVVSEIQKLQSLILEYQETAIMMHILSILQVYPNFLQYNHWLYCHTQCLMAIGLTCYILFFSFICKQM